MRPELTATGDSLFARRRHEPPAVHAHAEDRWHQRAPRSRWWARRSTCSRRTGSSTGCSRRTRPRPRRGLNAQVRHDRSSRHRRSAATRVRLGKEPRARDVAVAVHRRRFARRTHAGAEGARDARRSPWRAPKARPTPSKFRSPPRRIGSAATRSSRTSTPLPQDTSKQAAACATARRDGARDVALSHAAKRHERRDARRSTT